MFLIKKILIENISDKSQVRFETKACASYEIISFIENVLEVKFYFKDSTCYDQSNEVFISYIDNTGCQKRKPIIIEDPCDGFEFSETPIEKIRSLKFRANVELSDSLPYKYEWDYNRKIFEEVSKQDNTIELKIKKGNSVDEIQISVKVTNSNGCCINSTQTIAICLPEIHDGTEETICQDGKIEALFKIGHNDCEDDQCGEIVKIDWGTLIADLPERVVLENLGDGWVRLKFPSDFPKSVVNLEFQVKDTLNNLTYAQYCIVVTPCNDDFIFINKITGELGCDDCDDNDGPQGFAPDNKQTCLKSPVAFDVKNYINSSNEIDYTTFSFIAGENDMLISNNEIKTPNGLAVFGVMNKIVYTPESYGSVEVINFKVNDILGNTGIGLIKIFRTPTCLGNNSLVVTNDDHICIKAGQCFEFNPLDNDEGEYDASTLSAGILPGNVGTIETFNTGILKICADESFNGDYDLDYNVKDINGVDSNTSKISLRIVGELNVNSENRSYCKNDAFSVDLFTLINTTEQSYLWRLESEYVYINVDGISRKYYKGEVVGTDNSPVIDFRDTPTGTYQFSYGESYGSCSNRNILNIQILDQVKLPDNVELNVCISSSPIIIGEGLNLPSGIWENVTPGNLPVDAFDPEINGEGEYLWRYRVENIGTYNQVCDSVLEFKVKVHNFVYAGIGKCLDVCSIGKTSIIKEPCSDEIPFSKTCPVCLFKQLSSSEDKEITTGGLWYLEKAPQEKDNYIRIGGVLYLVSIGDKIPGNYDGCIDLGGSELGEYKFNYRVGLDNSECFSESQITIIVNESPCDPSDVDVKICYNKGDYNLLDLLLKNSPERNCILKNGEWELVDGDPTPFTFNEEDLSVINTSKSTLVDNKAEYRLRYIFGESPTGDCVECEKCNSCYAEVYINITVINDLSAGVPNHLTVCNGGTVVNLSSRLTKSVNGGKWKYLGYSDTNDPASPSELFTNEVNGLKPGDKITGNIVKMDNDTPGYYYFEYKVQGQAGCCSTVILVIQVVETVDPTFIEDGFVCTYPQNTNAVINPMLSGSGYVFNINMPEMNDTCVGNGTPLSCGFGEFQDVDIDPGYNPEDRLISIKGLPVGDYFFYFIKTVQEISYEIIYSEFCQKETIQITITDPV